jgi:hypothetical protein
MSHDTWKSGAGGGDMKPPGKERGDKWMPGRWDGKWGKDSMQKPGGGVQMMGGSKPSRPASIHMTFEFDVAPAAGAAQGYWQKEESWGDNMSGKGGTWGGKGGNWGDNKGMDWKKRPHRPIICRVNASGAIVARDCPFNLTCGGGKGIKQGNWTMYFCHEDPAMRDVTEFDYPDQSEFFHMMSDDVMKEVMGGDDNDDGDVIDGMGDKHSSK